MIHLDDPESVRAALDVPWGQIAIGGMVVQLACPLCQAIIPATYNNAHELSATPKDQHSSVHIAVADLLDKLRGGRVL